LSGILPSAAVEAFPEIFELICLHS
jgi:hypothetical protein